MFDFYKSMFSFDWHNERCSLECKLFFDYSNQINYFDLTKEKYYLGFET